MSRPWNVYDEISGSRYCGATVHGESHHVGLRVEKSRWLHYDMDDCMVIWITTAAMKGLSSTAFLWFQSPTQARRSIFTCSRKYDRSNMANMWKLGVAPLSRLSKLSHLMWNYHWIHSLLKYFTGLPSSVTSSGTFIFMSLTLVWRPCNFTRRWTWRRWFRVITLWHFVLAFEASSRVTFHSISARVDLQKYSVYKHVRQCLH